jgi:hypothetical protein
VPSDGQKYGRYRLQCHLDGTITTAFWYYKTWRVVIFPISSQQNKKEKHKFLFRCLAPRGGPQERRPFRRPPQKPNRAPAHGRDRGHLRLDGMTRSPSAPLRQQPAFSGRGWLDGWLAGWLQHVLRPTFVAHRHALLHAPPFLIPSLPGFAH